MTTISGNPDWVSSHLYPPDRLTIQVTNICNADCIFCGYQYLEDEKAFLKDEHFFSAIDQYSDMGGQQIDFTPLVGDLLVDKDIFNKLNYATKEKNFDIVKFYTNGILLAREKYPENLLHCGPTHVIFSVPGFEEELYKRVYRSKQYKSMISGVHEFLKLNHESGYPIKVSFALKPDISDDEAVYNTEDYKKYVEPYIQPNSLHFVRDLDNWGGSIKQTDLLGRMKLIAPPPIEEKAFPCYFTFFLALMVDGHVRLCGCRFNNGTEYDGLIVGHIEDNSLLEIWQNDKVREIRENFLKKKLVSVCETCTHYAPYSGKERTKYTIEEYMKGMQ